MRASIRLRIAAFYDGDFRAAARDPEAPPALLLALAEEFATRAHAESAAAVAQSVARHPSTPADALRALAKSPYWFVRNITARHPNLPSDVAATLAIDPQLTVVARVAANPVTPVPILTKLARHPNKTVQMNVAYNPSTPAAIAALVSTRLRRQ